MSDEKQEGVRAADGYDKYVISEHSMSKMSRDEIRQKFSGDRNWPIQSFDAQDWARAFMALFGNSREKIDEGLMLAWFASALMRGWDEREWQPSAAIAVVNEQADDAGLWFQPVYATEAMLQRALRRLHAAVEGKTPEECALATIGAAVKKG